MVAAPFINFAFGTEFHSSASHFYWPFPGIYCLGLVTVLSFQFAGRGFPREVATYWLAGLTVDLLLIVLFLERLGTYFASLASSITYAIILILHIQLFARTVGGLALLRPRFDNATLLARRLSGTTAGRPDEEAFH